MQTDMSFLIDSNVVIAAEPYDGRLEEAQPGVNSFLRLAAQHGHHVFVHPATREDLEQTRECTQRAQNLAAYEKYPALAELPVPPEVWEVFPSDPGPNDQRDARILAALHAEAVHFLVTNDARLRRRAARLGFGHRVLRSGEAAAQLAAWHPEAPPPPPMVERLQTYELDTSEPIFDSLRSDYYPKFDSWITKVKKEAVSRRAWVIRGEGGQYEALALVKMRDEHPLQRGAPAIKLATFKVGDTAGGKRYGELLLKAVLRWAAEEPGRPGVMFVEVNSRQERLVEFLVDFGFQNVTVKDGDPDEQVWLKELDPPSSSTLSGLDFHIRYGPPAVQRGNPIFVIPITPQWYEDLFPDATVVGTTGATMLADTFTTPKAHGNAIRKAYLCRSPTKEIPAGSTLLFYRSQGGVRGDGAVVAVGVTERSHRSEDPMETIELSFKRTVYSASDVAGMHQDGKAVLTILFRHDRFIEPPWSLTELVERKVITSWPQSVVRVRDPGGIEWVQNQLSA
ncbi:GNAT family N-acetyltransferase [Curtobacterium sp. UNCCL17]|uniref:GNAT family N-acetyltransferase n=1 Tax=Curtobacterium sp. UNCCL17 TaxID=1449051 RepID=UPI0012DC8681|nr:GNAT family N-acetyltransferase [Curtobacterium sp. UNCCL17]